VSSSAPAGAGRSLRGKVAIVTGGGSGGLGEAIARRLLEDGAQVLVSDLSADENSALVERLSGVGEVVGNVADVSRPDFGAPLAEAAQRAFGGIDIVVNNAATYPSKKWDE
jgi:NAD(P)-dependent dehydrogenase (short-subunit alcohol dehydrogenase family)